MTNEGTGNKAHSQFLEIDSEELMVKYFMINF